MKRLTLRNEAGELVPTTNVNDVLIKLAAYEDFHEEVLREYDRICEQIDERKQQGKMKGVTANQLIAQKMSLQNILLYFKRFGIGE